jgi:hypothetical protein
MPNAVTAGTAGRATLPLTATVDCECRARKQHQDGKQNE